MMLAIYLGARLVTGSLSEILIEFVLASIALGIARFAMTKWLWTIGIAVILHGAYDALIGPHTGVADWYPPLCAGFDLVVGIGLIATLLKREPGAATTTRID